MSADLQQVLDSISELKTEFKELKAEVRADIKEAKLDAKLFNTKFDYYQQATQWVIVLSFTLITAATAITIFASVFTFR